MADISKCGNEQCHLKERCYRYTVEPEPLYQSYMDFYPNEDGTCDDFWDNKQTK